MTSLVSRSAKRKRGWFERMTFSKHFERALVAVTVVSSIAIVILLRKAHLI